jgi:hypothetical protein
LRGWATKIKFWFWKILGAASKFWARFYERGRVGKIGGRRVKEKIMPRPLKKISPSDIMIPLGFFNLVSGSRHREALGFASLKIIFPSFRRHQKAGLG